MSRGDEDEGVTASVVGEWLGISEHHVRRMAMDRIIPKLMNGRYDLKLAVQAYVERQREVASGRGVNSELAAAQKQRAQIQTENAAFDLARKRGEYRLASEFDDEWTAEFRWQRGEYLSLVAGLPSRFPNLPRATISAIGDAIRETLTRIATGDRLGGPSDDGADQAVAVAAAKAAPVGMAGKRAAAPVKRVGRPRSSPTVAVAKGNRGRNRG